MFGSSRRRKAKIVAVLGSAALAAALAGAAPSHALSDSPAASDEDARRSRIAVRVGDRTVSVAELEDRLAEIPPYQAVVFGASREEIVSAFVDQVIVRDLLLGVGAEKRKLDESLPTKHQLQRARSTATLRALRKDEWSSPAAIPMDDVAKYYEANRARFDAPERVNLWRILCPTREIAETVLETAKRDLSIPKYNELAREHSIDKATNFRGGNLGFIAPDGASNEAGLKVTPALIDAASKVKDGDLVPHPVPEGEAFAVVWRRMTVPATRRSIDDAAAQIRTTIYRERTEAREKELIDELRAKHVRDFDAEPLKIIEFPTMDAGLGLPRSIPRGAGTPSSAP